MRLSRHDGGVLIRWGGEEFILLLSAPNTKTLYAILKKLRATIEPTRTCSIGGSLKRADEDIHQAVKRADEALYQAKQQGRNRVIVNP